MASQNAKRRTTARHAVVGLKFARFMDQSRLQNIFRVLIYIYLNLYLHVYIYLILGLAEIRQPVSMAAAECENGKVRCDS